MSQNCSKFSVQTSIRIQRKKVGAVVVTAGAALLFSCSQIPKTADTAFNLQQPSSLQLLVAVAADENAATAQLYNFQRPSPNAAWRYAGLTTAVTIGKNGLAWGRGLHPVQAGLQKVEGDGRAPAGLFGLGDAFGYNTNIDSNMPYQAMRAEHFCIDVPASPLYNQTVLTSHFAPELTAGSTEPMRRDIHNNGDQLYKKGLFIAHNPDNQPKLGSCIFMHLWRGTGQGTAGCTAMAEPAFDQILRWLDPKAQPLYLLLSTAQYQALQQRWALPELP